MDSLPSVSSISQDSEHSTSDAHVSAPGIRDGIRPWMWLVEVVLWGIVLGVVMTVGILFLPYDRVVVFGQPKAPVLRISSAHLKEGGFVIFFLRTKEGLSVAGESGYLPPGYYRNIVVPIDFSTVFLDQGREFIVRMYRDTGDRVFALHRDAPVTDITGQVYQKRIWLLYPGNIIMQVWLAFLTHPVSFFMDVLIP